MPQTTTQNLIDPIEQAARETDFSGVVSMLGEQANWVRNLRAAGCKATLRHGRVEQVLLEDVPVEKRAPLLNAYLQIAPGAGPHVSVDKDALLDEFEKAAAAYPVFKVNRRVDGIGKH